MFDHIAGNLLSSEQKKVRRDLEKSIMAARGKLPYKAMCEVTHKLTHQPKFSSKVAPSRAGSQRPRSKSPGGKSKDKKKTPCPQELRSPGSCKYKDKCYYNHDPKALAKARKQKPRSKSPKGKTKPKVKARSKSKGRRATPAVAGEEGDEEDGGGNGEDNDDEEGELETEGEANDDDDEEPGLVESSSDEEQVIGDSEIENLSDGESSCPSSEDGE